MQLLEIAGVAGHEGAPLMSGVLEMVRIRSQAETNIRSARASDAPGA